MVQPGSKRNFRLIGRLGYIDAPLTVRTTFKTLKYNNGRTDVDDQTKVAVLTRTGGPLQLFDVVLDPTKKMIEVDYCKNFDTCAHMHDEQGRALHTENLFCPRSGPIKDIPFSKMPLLREGMKVHLVHGNDSNIKSNVVQVGEIDLCEIIPTLCDGIDIELQNLIRWSSVNPDDPNSASPYLFGANVCIHGLRSLRELQTQYPFLQNGLPVQYKLIGETGINVVTANEESSFSGAVMDLKNGQCHDVSFSIQPHHYDEFVRAKTLELSLEVGNHIPETNEGNNLKSLDLSFDGTC